MNQIDLRLRGQSAIPHQILMSFNPISQVHWIRKRFFQNNTNSQDSVIIKTHYIDNNYLDKKYIQTIQNYKNIDQYVYQVYTLGQ